MGYHGSNQMPGEGNCTAEEDGYPVWQCGTHMTVTPRDLVDQYLPPYESYMRGSGDAWTGDPGGRAEGIMCAYSDLRLTNDTSLDKPAVPSCANEFLLKDVLRGQFKSPSVVQSDCCDSVSDIFVGHNFTETLEDAIALATNAGAQIVFGGNVTRSREAMRAAVKHGKVAHGHLTANVARALLTRFRLGEFDEGNPHGAINGDDMIKLIDAPAHRAIARRTAAESCVLLRNEASALPLLTEGAGAPKTIAVIGPFIDDADALLHSYNGRPSSVVTPLAAIRSTFHGAAVTFAEGIGSSVGGGGGLHPPGTHANLTSAVKLASQAELTIAVLGLGKRVEFEAVDRGEGPGDCPGTAISGDCRNTTAKGNLGFPLAQQELLRELRAVSKKLVLVVVSAGTVSLNVSEADAIVWAGYGGEEAGNGLVDALTGKSNRWGKMPTTTYATNYLEHVGPLTDFSMTSGVGRTYRYLDRAKSPPIFGFGFGLSLTTFEFSGLEWVNDTVAVAIQNTGARDGAEVAMLWVQLPQEGDVPTPRLSLQGFTKPVLRAGETRRLTFRLVPRQLSVAQLDGTWKLATGKVTLSVGGHQPGEPGTHSSNVVSISK